MGRVKVFQFTGEDGKREAWLEHNIASRRILEKQAAISEEIDALISNLEVLKNLDRYTDRSYTESINSALTLRNNFHNRVMRRTVIDDYSKEKPSKTIHIPKVIRKVKGITIQTMQIVENGVIEDV